MQPWWFSIVAAILGLVVGAILTYLRERAIQDRSHKHQKELAVFEKDYEKICNFISAEGVKELISFFKDKSPDKVLEYLKNLSALNQHFKKMERDFGEVKSELGSMRSMLSERLFNPVTGRIHDGIESNTKFASRLKEKDKSKMYLKDHWLNIKIVQDVLKEEESIFIESGSTLAYCMLSIIEDISKYRNPKKPRLRVCTNNVAIYMMLLFQDHFEPVLLPGKPDNPYAATFADINENGQHGDEIYNFLEANRVNVLFTTASYLDIDYGPHVGSVQNHAMKRILNDYARKDENRKNIFVIVAEKINQDVKEGKIDKKCKLIFDPDRTEEVVKNSEVLERTKRAWEEYLRMPQNHIIAGSNDTNLCSSKIESFRNQHQIDPYILQNGTGSIFEL
jgi:DeoR/GlpR family transcriptional regulator of sugar metabolism